MFKRLNHFIFDMNSSGSMLTRTSSIISIIVAILGILGIYVTPQNANFIIVGAGIVILLVYLFDKIQEISRNSEAVKDIYQKISINERLQKIESELSEQKGKLAMVVKK